MYRISNPIVREKVRITHFLLTFFSCTTRWKASNKSKERVPLSFCRDFSIYVLILYNYFFEEGVLIKIEIEKNGITFSLMIDSCDL